MTVAAGSYDYTVRTQRDYRTLYDGDTPMERLLADMRAMAVLERHLPGTVQRIDRTDAEAMSKSVNDLRKRAALFRTPTEPYDQAISALEQIKFSSAAPNIPTE